MEEGSDPKAGDRLAGVGEVREEYFRSGGKGGQNVNKVETGVRLRARINDLELLTKLKERFPGSMTEGGELLIETTRERSREQNRRLSYEKLEARIAEAREERKERVPTKPKRAAKERRLDEKRRRGETKRLRERLREW